MIPNEFNDLMTDVLVAKKELHAGQAPCGTPLPCLVHMPEEQEPKFHMGL